MFALQVYGSWFDPCLCAVYKQFACFPCALGFYLGTPVSLGQRHKLKSSKSVSITL